MFCHISSLEFSLIKNKTKNEIKKEAKKMKLFRLKKGKETKIEKKNTIETLIDAKNRFQNTNLEAKFTTNEEEFGLAKQLLIDLLNINNQSRQQRVQADNVLYDGYDSYAKHLIIKETKNNKVIAYARIIDNQTAYHIGGYYCEAQFNLQRFRFLTPSTMELSHIVIAHEYNNQFTIDLLYSKIQQYAIEQNIEIIFGTLTLDIENSHYTAIREINYIKSRYLSSNEYRVKPYQILPPTRAVAGNKFELPVIVNYLFDKGAQLCGDASWNSALNHAELFFCINAKKNNLSARFFIENNIDTENLVA